jgi:hypothetical protein
LCKPQKIAGNDYTKPENPDPSGSFSAGTTGSQRAKYYKISSFLRRYHTNEQYAIRAGFGFGCRITQENAWVSTVSPKPFIKP